MPSSAIYKNSTDFKPTWLCIKRHSVTGLKYFCKTTKKDPYSYHGSGSYWKRHIKVHGKKDIVTDWCEIFTDKNYLIEYALNFSIENNIVDSTEWANLIEENGIDGCTPGKTYTRTPEQIDRARIKKENMERKKLYDRVCRREKRIEERDKRRILRKEELRREREEGLKPKRKILHLTGNNDTRDVLIAFRVDIDESEIIKKNADTNGMSLSNFIRYCAINCKGLETKVYYD
jgi:hypothetical protein